MCVTFLNLLEFGVEIWNQLKQGLVVRNRGFRVLVNSL